MSAAMLLVPAVDAKGRALAGRGLAMQGAPPAGISAHADMGLFRRLQHASPMLSVSMNDSMSLSVKLNLSVGVSSTVSMSESVSLSLVVSIVGLIESKLAIRPTNGTGLYGSIAQD